VGLLVAGCRVPGDLDHKPAIPDLQPVPWAKRVQLDPLEGQVLAEGTGKDVVSFAHEASNRLHGVETDCLVDTTVARLRFDVTIISEAPAPDPLLGHRQLGNSARRDVDADDAT
jgi:hypothetical protein